MGVRARVLLRKIGVRPPFLKTPTAAVDAAPWGQGASDFAQQSLSPASAARPGHGIALANVRDRLHLLHDVQVRFQSGLHEGRYRVRIELPWDGPDARARNSEENPWG